MNKEQFYGPLVIPQDNFTLAIWAPILITFNGSKPMLSKSNILQTKQAGLVWFSPSFFLFSVKSFSFQFDNTSYQACYKSPLAPS